MSGEGLDSTAPPPSALMSMVGVSQHPGMLPTSDDAAFELFYDVALRRGWGLNQSTRPLPGETHPLWEAYEVGVVTSSGARPLVVLWCHVGLRRHSHAPVPLHQLALCLDEIGSNHGSIDALGVQMTIDLDTFNGWIPASGGVLGHHGKDVHGDPRMAWGSIARIGELPHDDRSFEFLDFSEVDVEILRRELARLHGCSDGLESLAISGRDVPSYAAAVACLASEANESGRRGAHRITVVAERAPALDE